MNKYINYHKKPIILPSAEHLITTKYRKNISLKKLLYITLILLIIYQIASKSIIMEEIQTKIATKLDQIFKIEKIIINGLDIATYKKLINSASYDKMQIGYPIYKIDPWYIKQNIEKNYRIIDTANVKILLPNTILISVKEKKPCAIWWHQKKMLLIDANGDIIGDGDQHEMKKCKNLIILVGKKSNVEFSKLLNIINESQFQLKKIELLRYQGERRWDIFLKDKVMIKLPENHVSTSLIIYKKLEKDSSFKNAKMIDLRLIPQRIFYK